MGTYTTRVELRDNANWDQYNRLHAEMERRGFSRTIVADDGVRYRLPWAEYDFRGNLSREAVLQAAHDAAFAAAPKNRRAVLVSESTARAWNGLERA